MRAGSPHRAPAVGPGVEVASEPAHPQIVLERGRDVTYQTMANPKG